MTRYRASLLRAGRLLLDGGGMFGLIPRVVWSRSIDTDDANRIELHHNCVLLEGLDPDPILKRPRRIILETGSGDKLDPKMAAIFGLDGRTVESALRDAGHDPADIDDVVVSHLHFDHAGGLTRRIRTGETPDWTAPAELASGDCRDLRFTFPNARIHAQRREWTDARNNTSVMTRTYYRDHLDPLELPLPDGAPRLILADSPRPFTPGLIPARHDRPRGSALLRATEILPGIRVFLVPGHTWGQQATLFHDADGRPTVFTPDVMPSRHHLGAAYSLAYDVEPYTSMITKSWFLEEAAAGGWTLILDHERDTPIVTVQPGKKGWFDLVPATSPRL